MSDEPIIDIITEIVDTTGHKELLVTYWDGEAWIVVSRDVIQTNVT